MAEYVAAKAHLLWGETPPEAAVLNARDENTRRIGEGLTCPVTWFTGERDLPRGYLPDTVNPARVDTAVYEREGSIVIATPTADGVTETPVLEISRIRIPGRHNVENFMTAISLTRGYATPADVTAVANTFTGVPHRLELVREIPREGGAIRFYNSSIDSSPTRSVAALSAMAEMNTREGRRPPVVICGGQDKHVPFDPFAEGLCAMASAVILTGEARDQILDALNACPAYDPERLPVTVIPDYREAMKYACETATEGDTILLSPACTSFDAFKNFAERGEVFRGIVKEL
jgi:UDP-N-acetylmuramoylalanine--D-glutamate ligase